MNKSEFRQLLRKYLDGECNDEEIQKIDHWYSLLGEHTELDLTETEKEKLKNRLWQKIEAGSGASEVQVIPLLRRFKTRWIAAAALLLIGGFSYWALLKENLFYERTTLTVVSQNGISEQINETRSTQKIQLSDGSVVELSPESSIRFTEKFEGDKREVFLLGNAFFKVARNPEKPFYVYCGKIVTQVLGTSFWVRGNKSSKAVEVEVRTGKVSVFEQKNDKNRKENVKVSAGVILTPNQKVVYFSDNDHWVTGLSANPLPIVDEVRKQEKTLISFAFNETPLPLVLKDLEQVYGIDFMMENESLRNCTFTGEIMHQTLYNKLELICQAIDATYEIRGTHILISGKGCN